MLIVGSAGFVRGALDGQRAEVVYLGVGQLGLQPEQYLVDYWTETVRTVGARRVVLIHWDDFFRPLHKPLRALPYAGDDLDVSMRVLSRLAARRRHPAAPAHAVAALRPVELTLALVRAGRGARIRDGPPARLARGRRRGARGRPADRDSA